MKRSLRILHSENSVGWGGQELRILHEARGMAERGHDVSIACPPDSEIFSAAHKMKIPVTGLPISRRNLSALSAVIRFLRHNTFDIINTHSSTDSWLFATAAKFLRLRTGLVRTRHISADVGRDPFTHWVYRYGAGRVVTTGERLRKNLIERNGLPPEHVVSVPTGIDLEKFVPGSQTAARLRLGLPVDKPLIGVVATLRSWKGHRYLIDAADILRDTGFHYAVVGDGPQRENISQQLGQLNLTDRFTCPGNTDNVADWMQAMDIFVLPSYANEGVPQSIMQAMACGLPVISTPVGSITEAVADGETGRIIPAQNAALLASEIRNLMEDGERRRHYGAAARRKAVSEFGKEKMLDRMEDVFDSVLPVKAPHCTDQKRVA